MSLHGNAAVTITDYYDVPASAKRPTVTSLSVSEAQNKKYAKSGLNNEQLLEHKHRLEQIMQQQHIYLRPDLTLPLLAQTVECSVNHLSQVINSGFGMSFFDYLNQHRIAHARKLLSRPDQQGSAILNIAFTVGFNSNSAFYAAFRKWVGQTPAQYRRANLRTPH
jgi:AraC-like DNA-binding protein